MRLVAAEVQKFKSISDSGRIDIEPDVTALVGKNESGKTAVLQALYRLNPIASGHPTGFQELRDYPRRHRARDRAKIAECRPVRMTFEYEAEDLEALADAFGDSLAETVVTISKQYGRAAKQYSWILDAPKALAHIIRQAGLEERFAKDTLEDTVAALEADDSELAQSLAKTLAERDLESEAEKLLAGRLPRIQYFDEYSILPGAVSINRLQQVDESELNPDERTALSLLRLAGVADEEFTEAEYEARKAALEAAANALTDELFEYWTQNAELEVELDIEFRPVPGQPASPEPWMQIRVRNRKHRVTLNMAERSKGFIWFFSFLAAFSEYADEDRRVILLDEPGLNLHAKAQRDLLRFIDERLAPNHQVIYSTHSLFMIDPDRLERCRTVEDFGDEGTVVSKDVWSARPETVFPLLGALGVDLSQTLIIGPNQLLVEGPADVVYLNLMNEACRSAGKSTLSPSWTITPVGGIDKIPTFVALMGGSDLNVTVLMDVATGGNQKVADLVRRGLLDASRLVPVTEFTGTREADIEDMFDRDWYLGVLEKSKVGKIAKTKVKDPEQRIVKLVELALGERFDHFQPAGFLLGAGNQMMSSIDEATIDRFEALFSRLNDLL